MSRSFVSDSPVLVETCVCIADVFSAFAFMPVMLAALRYPVERHNENGQEASQCSCWSDYHLG